MGAASAAVHRVWSKSAFAAASIVVKIVAISGPSGSGKSWLANALCNQLTGKLPEFQVDVIPEDAYYRDQSHLKFSERIHVNYDHPDALEHELMQAQLAQLRASEPVQIPVYDYVNHTRAQRVRPVKPAPILIVEGVLILTNPELRNLFDLTLYMDTPLDVCIERRVQRDIRERGRTEISVREQFASTVQPMYERFVAPAKQHADVLVDGIAVADQELHTLTTRILSLTDHVQATDPQS